MALAWAHVARVRALRPPDAVLTTRRAIASAEQAEQAEQAEPVESIAPSRCVGVNRFSRYMSPTLAAGDQGHSWSLASPPARGGEPERAAGQEAFAISPPASVGVNRSGL